MVPLPTSIRVAAYDVKITAWTGDEGTIRQRFGEWSGLSQEIRLDVTRDPVKQVDTLLHELNHAIYWAYGIEDEDNEERLCAILSTAYTQVFRDNPQVLHFIKENLK